MDSPSVGVALSTLPGTYCPNFVSFKIQTLMHTYSMNHVDISNIYEYLQYLEIDEVAADTSLLTSMSSIIKRTTSSLNHGINPKNMITIL